MNLSKLLLISVQVTYCSRRLWSEPIQSSAPRQTPRRGRHASRDLVGHSHRLRHSKIAANEIHNGFAFEEIPEFEQLPYHTTTHHVSTREVSILARKISLNIPLTFFSFKPTATPTGPTMMSTMIPQRCPQPKSPRTKTAPRRSSPTASTMTTRK